MTEKLLNNELIKKNENFDENYKVVMEKFQEAALKSSRNIDDIILLAATKTVPVEVINHALCSGIRFMGENRVQEFLSKYDQINKPTHMHFIGHLQTNKVKDIKDKVEMIESVHSMKLAETIGKQCSAIGKSMDVLLEVNIGEEKSKSGFSTDKIEEAVYEIAKIKGVNIKGLMTIPPICNTENEIRRYFCKMYKLFIDIRNKRIDNSAMVYLSMGMSDDFDIAIQEGANIVRIGTALFGKRAYI